MRLIILLVVVAWSNADKLDRTYLPPTHAQTSGGSGNFLQTPASGASNDYQRNSFAQNAGRNYQSQHDNGQQRETGLTKSTGSAHKGFGLDVNNYNGHSNAFNQASRAGNTFDQNQNVHAQSGNYNNGNFGTFDSRPERAQAAFERNAAILRQDSQNDGETYAYAYETENGIVAEENGVATNGVEAQGGYSYTGDDGQVYSIRYTADQNGFVPQGDHLPTPPPVPEEILKALEQNARDEAAGIFDDGSYNEAKYGNHGDNQYNNNNYNNGNNYNGGNSNANNINNKIEHVEDDEDTVVTNNALLRGSYRNQAGSNNLIGNQRQAVRNQGVRNQANSVNNAYLPPLVRQSGQSNERNAFGRRQQSFDDRNGYQY